MLLLLNEWNVYIHVYIRVHVWRRDDEVELDTLEAGTRALARGDFEHRIEIDRDDEFGRLAQAFNHMTNQIGALDRMSAKQSREVHSQAHKPITLQETRLGHPSTVHHALPTQKVQLAPTQMCGT